MAAVQNPTVTPQLRERARQSPDSWIYVVDPGFEDAPEVPGWAVVGAYRVDERGEVAEEFRSNPDYRPTPAALGFPPPENELEAALQRAVTGHGDDDEVRQALLDATVFIPHLSGVAGVAGLDEGLDQQVVHAFTSERYLPGPGTWRHWERLPVRDLVEPLGERYLLLNPGSDLELRLPGRDLS